MTQDTILLVDDDPELCSLLCEFLRGEGFDVSSVSNGKEAIDYVLGGETQYHAMVLDIMMPVVSGFDVLQAVRKNSDIPIIMLTGRGDDIDRILGLEMGADDYLGKPCNPKELAARLRAVLRRTRQPSQDVATSLSHKGIVLNPGSLKATVHGQVVEFTQAEFRVLQLLMHSVGQTLSKRFLTQEVLQRKLGAYDRSIDVHISRIRHKLAHFDELNDLIKAVRGVGYQMISDECDENTPRKVPVD